MREQREMTDLQKLLFSMQDEKYRAFQSPLVPTVESERLIGVRTPRLRALAKEIIKGGVNCEGICNREEFLSDLPHRYFEENQLHSFIISEVEDIERVLVLVDEFLPFIDNWALCDSLIPKAFSKNKDRILPFAYKWIKSDAVYTARFGVLVLMKNFLGEAFLREIPEAVASIHAKGYYIDMMRAWFFAEALIKQYSQTIIYIENERLPKWIHNKTISKACDSFRISAETKSYLKTLRIK